MKERWIVQISGKMLIASSSTIVGAMNSQAMARSESPRTMRPALGGVALGDAIGDAVDVLHAMTPGCRGIPGRAAGDAGTGAVWRTS